MPTVHIRDIADRTLAVHLRDLLDLFGPRASASAWMIAGVPTGDPPVPAFEAIGQSAAKFEDLAVAGAIIPGAEFVALARDAGQIVWGSFSAAAPGSGNASWLTIRFIDSTFCEIETPEMAVLDAIRKRYKDVRTA